MQGQSGIKIPSLPVCQGSLKVSPEPLIGQEITKAEILPSLPLQDINGLKGLTILSKQDQGPCLPTTTLQSGDVLRARFTQLGIHLRILVSLQVGVHQSQLPPFGG